MKDNDSAGWIGRIMKEKNHCTVLDQQGCDKNGFWNNIGSIISWTNTDSFYWFGVPNWIIMLFDLCHDPNLVIITHTNFPVGGPTLKYP